MTASIVALFTATSAVAQYLRNVKNAGKEITELKKEVSILQSLLYTLNSFRPQRTPSAPSSELWDNVVTILAVENGPLEEYSRVLLRIQVKVEKTGPLRSTLQWVLNKDDVKEMLEKIERLKTTISLHLNISQL